MFKSYTVSSIYKKTLRALALGCALAVLRSVRTAPTAILREQE